MLGGEDNNTKDQTMGIQTSPSSTDSPKAMAGIKTSPTSTDSPKATGIKSPLSFTSSPKSMGIKTTPSSTDSPKLEVGEIDTRAPFESVKAAVSLFGEAAFSGSSGEKPVIRKSKEFFTERMLAKEAQLQLAQKELNKFKEQLKIVEITKGQALTELEKAKRTAEDLTNKLTTINESKELAMKAIEAATTQANQLKEANSGDLFQSKELDLTNEEYSSSISQLNEAKQELRKIKQDFELSMEAKQAAFNKAIESETSTKANKERVDEIKKEISSTQESIKDVKLASLQAQQEHAKILSEKDSQRKSYFTSLEETKKKLASVKETFDPEVKVNLEAKLSETTSEVKVLEDELKKVKTSDFDSVETVTLELDDAKETLQKIVEEENSLKSLKIELENVKKEHLELKEKEAETEAIAGNLHVKLRKSKAELENVVLDESKARNASTELVSTLQQLSLESDTAKKEAEDIKKNVQELNEITEATRVSLRELELKLETALKEAEAAKTAEIEALELIKILSDKTIASRGERNEDENITISTEEFEALNRKVEESDILAEMKVAAAMAQVEAVKASENEAVKKLETSFKEIEEMKLATEEALKRAEMAEMAKKAVEGELRRWREKEQKRAEDTAARILAENDMSSPPPPPQEKVVSNNNIIPEYQNKAGRKMEKTHVSRKSLLPSISGIFHKKKNQSEGGSPSYLPGEK